MPTENLCIAIYRKRVGRVEKQFIELCPLSNNNNNYGLELNM